MVRFRPELIIPKLAGDVTVDPGLPGCVKLNRLNASNRSVMVFFSVMLLTFCSEKSTCPAPGPRAMWRPRLPQVRLAGVAKAAGLNQFS